MKKMLAWVLTLATLLSCMCLPAFAAESSYELKILNIQEMGSSYDEDSATITSADAGDVVVVTVGIVNNSAADLDVSGFSAFIAYDEAVMEPFTGTTPFKKNAYSFNSELSGDYGWSGTGDFETAGYISFAGGGSDPYTVEAGQTLVCFRIGLKVLADVESGTSALSFMVGKDNAVFDDNGDALELATFVPASLTIKGNPPALTTVALSASTATADGENDVTLQASAASAKGTDITKMVTWSVDPADKGVEINASTGAITVDAKADAGEYAIKATADDTNVTGSSVSETLTVAREESKLSSLTLALDKATAAVPKAGETVTLQASISAAEDQYGPVAAPAVTYYLVGALEGIAVDGESGKIEISADAIKNTFTDNQLTVTVKAIADSDNNVSDEKSFTLKREEAVAASIEITAPASTVVEVPVSGTVTSGKYTVVVKDQYGQDIKNPDVTWKITETTGVSVPDGVVTVDAAAKGAITDTTGKTLTITATCGTESDTAEVTVKRAASVVTSVNVATSSDLNLYVPADGEEPAKYNYLEVEEVLDQYDRKMTSDELSGKTVTWTVTDKDGTAVEGISIDNGTVTVTNAAKKTVTDEVLMYATAEIDGVVSNRYGFWVERHKSEATKLEVYVSGTKTAITEDIIGIPGEKTYEAALYDQYSTKMNEPIGWSLAEKTGFTLNGSKVTVAEDVADNTFTTLTASAEGKSAEVKITARTVDVNWSIIGEPSDEIRYGAVPAVAFEAVENWPVAGTATAYINGKATTVNGTFTIGELANKNVTGEATTIPVTFTINDANAGSYNNASFTRNYNVTVVARPVTITVAADAIEYGAAIPTNFDAVATAGMMAYSETIADLALAWSVETAAEYVPGEYDIIATTTNKNYEVTVEGVLTVTKAKVTLLQATVYGSLKADDAKNASEATLLAVLQNDIKDITGSYAKGTTGLKTSGLTKEATPAYDQKGGVTYTYTVSAKNIVPTAADKFEYAGGDLTVKITVEKVDVTLAAFDPANATKTVSQTNSLNEMGIPEKVAATYTGANGSGSEVDYAITGWTINGADYDLAETLTYIKDQAAKVTNDKNVEITMTPVLDAKGWETFGTYPTFKLVLTAKYPVEVALTATVPATITYGETYDLDLKASQTEVNGNGTDESATYTYLYEGTTANGETYSSDKAPTEAGTYTVTASVDSDTHTGTSNSISFTIDPKVAALEWTVPANMTYTGKAQGVTASVTNLEDGDSCTVIMSGATATDAGSYTATATGLSNKNYVLPETGLTCGYEIAKAERTITLSTETIALVGTNTASVKVTLGDKEGIVNADSFTFGGSVAELTGYSARNGATFKATGNGTDTVTVAVPVTDNYLAASETINVIAVAEPILEGYDVEGPAYDIKCDVTGNKITFTAKSVTPENVTVAFETAEVTGATISYTISGSRMTVTVEAAGQTFTLPYTVSINIEKVDVKINEGAEVTTPDTAVVSGFFANIPDDVLAAIVAAAKEKGLQEVTVNVDYTVSGNAETGYTITAAYEAVDNSGETPKTVTEGTFTKMEDTYVKLPTTLTESDVAFVKHVVDGKETYLDATIIGSDLIFYTDDLSGTFTVTGDPYSITVNFDANADGKFDAETETSKTYTLAGVRGGEDDMPVGYKSGYTFRGWKIGDKSYYSAAEELLAAYNGEEVTATPIFTKKSSGSSKTYEIIVEDTEDGTVRVSDDKASKGETVTITVKPDEGYELVKLIVTDDDGDKISLTEKKNGKFTFKMPASEVTVEAVFDEIEEEVETSFSDVAENAYYFDAVEWAVEEGITTGYANGTFLPNNTCTRAQTVTFLWRAMGEPEPETTAMPFTDVAPGSYYYDAVLWAMENGITTGVNATTFAPNKTVTRAQTVTFLWRAAVMEGYDVSVGEDTNILSYADAQTIGAYAIPAMQWACGEGIMGGYNDGTLRPNVGCTRAQIVTFLYRFLG